MKLKYKTIEMSDPRGKPKVYFSCHPQDFKQAFPLLSEDVFRYSNCAIWYDAALDGEEPAENRSLAQLSEEETELQDQETLEETFEQMSLFVFPVTSRFLDEPSRARDIDLPFAVDKHIPILPILLETGLEYRFNEVCAAVQVVNRYVSDSTATPYEEVLENFLHSVLVGDELAARVRDAFDAYVFLSYRKKDRRHAHRLMHLIHENERFRDIAIWYDEYLIPGEEFDKAIKLAFEKSSLFALAVTPQILEADNYVMEVEYPLARERKKKQKGFEIVPVEMYEIEKKDPRTNQGKLKEKYEEIPLVQDEHKRPELDAALIDALDKISKKENDGSAVHRFFIGLAYQCGIDVQVDHARAVALLSSAAKDPEEPCMDATQKLADMYATGDGVKRDAQEAIYWQEILVGQALDAYKKCSDPDEHKGYGTLYFKALQKLSDMQREDGKRPEAMASAQAALAFCDKLEEEVGIREMQRDKALTLNRLGSLYRKDGQAERAEECYRQAAAIYEKLAAQIGTQRARRDLSIGYERLGDLNRKKGAYDQAEVYYKKTKALRDELCKEEPQALSRRDLSAVLTKLGNVRKSQKDMEGAGAYYKEALEMDRVLAEELKTPQAADDYGVSLVKMADIYKAEDQLVRAGEDYAAANEIFRKNVEATGSRLFREHYAASIEKLASVKKKTGYLEEAAALYKEAVNLRETLYADDPTPEAAHALAAGNYNAASFCKEEGMMKRAYEVWKDLCVTHPEYVKYRDKAAGKLGIK